MAKVINVQDAHYDEVKIDHRNGEEKQYQADVEIRPKIDGYHNETLRDKSYFGRDFITIFKTDLYHLVKEGNLSLREWKVFMYLCSTLDKNNITFTNLDVLAKELSMDRGDVSRTLTKLKKRNLIIEHKLSHRRGDGPVPVLYCLPIAQLNCNIVYNGQTKNYKQERLNHPQITKEDGTTLIDEKAEQQRKIAELKAKRASDLFPETITIPDEEPRDPIESEWLVPESPKSLE